MKKESKDFTEISEIPTFNVRKMVTESAANLDYLQKQRTKANHKRKPAYQAKIDAHFFG